MSVPSRRQQASPLPPPVVGNRCPLIHETAAPRCEIAWRLPAQGTPALAPSAGTVRQGVDGFCVKVLTQGRFDSAMSVSRGDSPRHSFVALSGVVSVNLVNVSTSSRKVPSAAARARPPRAPPDRGPQLPRRPAEGVGRRPSPLACPRAHTLQEPRPGQRGQSVLPYVRFHIRCAMSHLTCARRRIERAPIRHRLPPLPLAGAAPHLSEASPVP